MHVTETRLMPSRLELVRPLKTARATYWERRGFLVQLVDEEGRVGQGEAMPLPEFGTEPLDTCELVIQSHLKALRDQVFSDSLDAIEEAFMIPRGDPTQWKGIHLRVEEDLPEAPAADHAVELALLDLLAQRLGVPLSRLLSRSARSEVEVNALLTSDGPQELAEEARRAVAEGYRTLKIKVAGRPIDADEARVRAVREAVGSEVNLRLDANGGWSEKEALQALERLSWYGLELCEQPVAPDDHQALWRVQRRVQFPLAADEAIANPASIPVLLGTAGGMPAARIFVLKPMVLGGLLPALMFARQAARQGLGAYVTSSLDGVVSRAGAAHLAAALPWGKLASGLGVGSLFKTDENDPAERAFRPVGGRIVLPDAPGLGLPK
ncbi:O-succinylbenzoate synthase [Hyalangium minutum]|uniref:o-succinylbenzoate synthase n=2 Tax=Hyalangium minutum TaxID=394096 RepID=A0A085WRP0_9BACT|nr:o-succinylbenzoate synthase [Hyalangium minutum]KFE70353.1 O-succinylbenzoate synthase [Hyalangium minutum]